MRYLKEVIVPIFDESDSFQETLIDKLLLAKLKCSKRSLGESYSITMSISHQLRAV